MEVKARRARPGTLKAVITVYINLLSPQHSSAPLWQAINRYCASSAMPGWSWQISTSAAVFSECNLGGTASLPAAGLGGPIQQTAGQLHALQGDSEARFPCGDNTWKNHCSICLHVHNMYNAQYISEYKCTVRARKSCVFWLVPSLRASSIIHNLFLAQADFAWLTTNTEQ